MYVGEREAGDGDFFQGKGGLLQKPAHAGREEGKSNDG
jgi:hypothetical protein